MFEYSNAEEFKEKAGYTTHGMWLPRVTKIVSIKTKPALHFFYASIKNYSEGERIKKCSADEGTRIHKAAQALMTEKPADVQPDIKPAIDTFIKFWEKNKNKIEVNPESIEQRIVDYKHRFAGTVDAIIKIGDKIGVMDIKTSQSIYRDYNLQTAAYMSALTQQRKDINTRWILRIDQHKKCQKCGAILREKGGRKKTKIDRSNPIQKECNHEWGPTEGDIEIKEFPYWKEDFEGFLGAKKLWEWENRKWLKEIGYF